MTELTGAAPCAGPKMSADNDQVSAASQKPYTSPRVISAEALEVAAAFCGTNGPLGKTAPFACGTLGS